MVILRRLTWLEEKALLEESVGLNLWCDFPVWYHGKFWWRVR
jgi:hypothetical protein